MSFFNRAIRTLGAFVIFISICGLSRLEASDLWLNQGSSDRDFLSVENNDRGLLLKHYHQNRGDYQDLVDSHFFKSLSLLRQYVKSSYPSYSAVTALTVWPIRHILPSDSSSKGIFGGKKNIMIWIAKNQWSEEWELKYADWLQNQVTPDFYQRYKIPTDCADALIGLRWIFSRINSLPVANTVADTGELFGQFSMRRKWQKLDTADNWYEDQLFLTALNYVMDLTSSRTVMSDAYPVKIDRQGLIPGDFVLTQNNGSGHAKIITETHYDEITELPLYTLASTSPRAVRPLVREVLADQEWPTKGLKEILAFRWPIEVNSVWVLQKKENQSRYSEEQYDPKLKEQFPAFIQFILSRVKETYDPLKLVEMGVKDILNYVQQRVQVVDQGYEFCKTNPCKEGTSGFEDWSTPSRDAKLLKKFSDIDDLVRQFEKLSPGIYELWMNSLRNTSVSIEGFTLSLSSLRYIFEQNLTSIRPSETPLTRWGLDADKLVTNWLARVEQLLTARSLVIQKSPAPCGAECFPKNNAWLELDTYHIDAELNQLYVQEKAYCAFAGADTCQKLIAVRAQKFLTLNGYVNTLANWFEVIPFLHSDPRVSFARRWGFMEGGARARILPYFETIKISSNQLALLDNKKLINLADGKLILEVKNDTRLFLTEAGIVYKFIDSTADIQRLVPNTFPLEWVSIQDPAQILSTNKDRLVAASENNGRVLFKKTLGQGQIIFKIVNDQAILVQQYSGTSNQFDSLLTLTLNKSSMTLIDLDKNKTVNLTIPLDLSFRDMNQVRVLSYSYPQAVLEYNDPDWGLYYPILVDLDHATWKILDPAVNENFVVLWSSARLKKALIQTKVGQEFPELYAINWDDSGVVKSQRLANLFLGAREFGDDIYLIQGTGSQWAQSSKNDLLIWNKKIQVVDAPADSTPQFLTETGAYFSSANSGFLRSYDQSTLAILPKSLLPQDEFCSMQSASTEVFSYRFDTSYGDYSCMGGGLGFSSKQANLDQELVPDFSLYSWINKESLLDQRWRNNFIQFNVKAGTLVSIGRNIAFWWKP